MLVEKPQQVYNIRASVPVYTFPQKHLLNVRASLIKIVILDPGNIKFIISEIQS
jgi:hypothetical protein